MRTYTINVKGKDIVVECPTPEEYEAELKKRVRMFEEWYIDTKKLLEEVFKNKIAWPPDDEHTIWFKDDLRESKNNFEKMLADARGELTFHRQCAHPPCCYADYKTATTPISEWPAFKNKEKKSWTSEEVEKLREEAYNLGVQGKKLNKKYIMNIK